MNSMQGFLAWNPRKTSKENCWTKWIYHFSMTRCVPWGGMAAKLGTRLAEFDLTCSPVGKLTLCTKPQTGAGNELDATDKFYMQGLLEGGILQVNVDGPISASSNTSLYLHNVHRHLYHTSKLYQTVDGQDCFLHVDEGAAMSIAGSKHAESLTNDEGIRIGSFGSRMWELGRL